MHRLFAILRQVCRENKNVIFMTAFKDGQFTQSNGDTALCSRVTLLDLAHVLDYASVAVTPLTLKLSEASGSEM